MFIWGATREMIPNAKLTNSMIPTIGNAIHNALAKAQRPTVHGHPCAACKNLINRECMKAVGDGHDQSTSVHSRPEQQGSHLPKEAGRCAGLGIDHRVKNDAIKTHLKTNHFTCSSTERKPSEPRKPIDKTNTNLLNNRTKGRCTVAQ